MITAEVIKDLNSNYLNYVSGPLSSIAKKVMPPSLCDEESLAFVSTPEHLALALKAKVSIIIGLNTLSFVEDLGTTFFSTPSIPMAMASILPLFDGKMNRFNQETKIHPTAVIHPSAHLGKNVGVGAHAVIGENAKVGDGSTIGALAVIESFAEIGAHSLLHPHVFVGSHCHIGSHCEIHPHTTIGSDGFSFAISKDGSNKKIPQIGRVFIGDNVEIGANCAIDRAALTETRIGNCTKLDNNCHIAHNVIIGENCLIAASFSIAGSSTIGNNFMCGGVVAVVDHINICDRVIIAGRSVITNDITKPGQYGGYPLEPMRDSLKTLVNMTYLTRMRKNLTKIMKHLGIEED
jgi:UDP-3-O-[3-hydroxymyristoyl] glucosamine N-acyltransferase